MPYRKITGCVRLTCRILSLLLFALLTINGAQAQTITTIRRDIDESIINNPRSQYFPFSYEAKGSSIWGSGVPGSQQIDFSLPLVSLPWTEHIGAFFDPCFGIFGGCEFGAGLEAGLSSSTSANFHAKGDLGSVDLHCPGGVGIIYPKGSDIHPGQPFTILTYCVVDRDAYMNINATNLSLAIDGHIDAQIDLSLIAEAAGYDLVNINLFKLLGLPNPSISGDQELFNTGNLARSIQDIPLPIPPNIGSGYFHVPNLGARGTLNSDKLKARAADNFLTFNADLTNLLLQYAAFGIPIPLNGAYDFGGFNFSFRLLDLQLQAAAGIRQDFTFDPRPLIQFKVLGGATQTIRAGDSVTYTAPSHGTLRITPTIVYDQNTFTDNTSVTVDPTLSFDLIQIKGGGRVAGHNLFSFDLDPFGTQTATDTFDVPLFGQSFALPAPARFTCPVFIINGSLIAEVSDFSTITRVLTGDGNGSATISGTLPDAANSTLTLHIQGSQGSQDTSSDVNGNGYFAVTLRGVSQLGQYRPLTVTGEYLNPATGRTIAVNPVTIYWPRPALQASLFDPITFDPNRVPNGRLVAYAGTGQFTLPLHSFNVEPDAALLYDDIPIPTTIAHVDSVSDGYLLTGEIPGFLMNRGGVHTLSFLNSGLNQQPVLLQSVLVNNAVPAITDVLQRKSEVDGSAQLLVRGSGFTLDTGVKIGGQTRTVTLASPAELRVPLLPADAASGIHPVVVSNPAPGGGSATGSYAVAPIVPDIPSLVAVHDLTRHQPAITNEPEGDTVADLITLTNAGKNVLDDVTITSVKLLVNGKTYAESGFPQRLPVLRPGRYSGAQGILPPHSSVAGDVGVLQVRGTVHGKAFVLSNRVTLPAYDM